MLSPPHPTQQREKRIPILQFAWKCKKSGNTADFMKSVDGIPTAT